MKISNVSFNETWVRSFATEREFLEEMRGEGYGHIFSGKGRSDKLRQVYRQVKGENKPENQTDSFDGV